MTPVSSRPFLLTLGLLTLASSALGASVAAGTSIINQASATFDPVYPGESGTANSNVVVTTVQAVCAVSVTSRGGADAAILPGEQTTLRFTVTNVGNDSFELPLTLSSSGSTPSPVLSLYEDLNGNGALDAGEPQTSSLKLAPDASANLIAVVQTADTAQGDALVNLVASCGQGAASAAASSQVRVSPPPVLSVHKTFTPSLIKPGTESTVNVSTTNSGQGESRQVLLTDLLTEQLAQGLSFVAGSAQTNLGTLEYSTDGTTWSTQETAPVRGVRVRADKLAPNAQINLSFRMLAAEGADGHVIANTATALTGTKTTSDTAQLDVRYQPGVAIGPVGAPLAAENTPADRQTLAFAVVGKEVCFDHTIQNTGDVRDTFTTTVTYPQGGATAKVYGSDGQPLVQPLPLDPGQTALVRVCYTPSQTGALEALITASGARGTSNTTRDQITDIQAGLPELKKSYVASATDANGQTTTLADGATVGEGNTITYTLSVHNPYTRPLTNVVVSDPVPAHVDVVSASASGVVGGASGAQTVTWTLGTLAAGETRVLNIVTRVSKSAVDGENLSNIFSMVSTELPAPLPSNEVKTPVWNAALNVSKTVSAQTVTYGDKVTYTLTITNTSPTTAIESAVVADTPAKGLMYLPGTTTVGGAPVADPTIKDRVMTWTVATVPPGGQVVLTYDMRITPEATSDLVNEVQVSGIGAGGAARAVASNRASRVIKLDPLKFAPVADLIGRVYVDRNRNGLYDAGIDTPVERARVILAGGRLAVTDLAGRYHFANVPHGTWALRLDPNTTPYPPMSSPQDGGLSGTRTVVLGGLTTVDFPLLPLGGDVQALRQTTLSLGDVTVRKAVYAVPGGYAVSLKLQTPRALPGFQLNDPLPVGAVLKEGRNTLDTTLSAGETDLTYRFDWTGAPEGATTDPAVSWRY